MDEAKRKRLEALGGRVTTVEEFLGLSSEEMTYIELKLALAKLLKEVRKEKALTQVEVAEQVSSSQSRIAKMEKGDPSVTIDLLFKTLLELGATREEIGRVIAKPAAEPA